MTVLGLRSVEKVMKTFLDFSTSFSTESTPATYLFSRSNLRVLIKNCVIFVRRCLLLCTRNLDLSASKDGGKKRHMSKDCGWQATTRVKLGGK